VSEGFVAEQLADVDVGMGAVSGGAGDIEEAAGIGALFADRQFQLPQIGEERRHVHAARCHHLGAGFVGFRVIFDGTQPIFGDIGEQVHAVADHLQHTHRRRAGIGVADAVVGGKCEQRGLAPGVFLVRHAAERRGQIGIVFREALAGQDVEEGFAVEAEVVPFGALAGRDLDDVDELSLAAEVENAAFVAGGAVGDGQSIEVETIAGGDVVLEVGFPRLVDFGLIFAFHAQLVDVVDVVVDALVLRDFDLARRVEHVFLGCLRTLLPGLGRGLLAVGGGDGYRDYRRVEHTEEQAVFHIFLGEEHGKLTGSSACAPIRRPSW
jgi:hypothetical protein